jgi:putative tricarboxylic transport membrane protein
MKIHDILSGLLLLALALAIGIDIQSYPVIPGQNIGPGAFPGLLAFLLAICAVILMVKGWRSRAQSTEHQAWFIAGDWLQSRLHLRNFFVTLGCLLFYILASETLGFLICAPLILMAMFGALGVKPKWIVPLAVCISLVIHTIFYKGLRVPLPWGILLPLQW